MIQGSGFFLFIDAPLVGELDLRNVSVRHWTATARGYRRRREKKISLEQLFHFQDTFAEIKELNMNCTKRYQLGAPTSNLTSCSAQLFWLWRRSTHTLVESSSFLFYFSQLFTGWTRLFLFFLFGHTVCTHNLRPRYHVTVMWLLLFFSPLPRDNFFRVKRRVFVTRDCVSFLLSF